MNYKALYFVFFYYSSFFSFPFSLYLNLRYICHHAQETINTSFMVLTFYCTNPKVSNRANTLYQRIPEKKSFAGTRFKPTTFQLQPSSLDIISVTRICISPVDHFATMVVRTLQDLIAVTKTSCSKVNLTDQKSAKKISPSTRKIKPQ